MFNIKESIKNGFDIVTLSNADDSCFAEIIPSCAGILHSFSILTKNGYHNVIDSYENFEAYNSNKEALGFKSAKMNPFVCRVKNGAYSFENVGYQLNKYKLGDHAIHGLLYDEEFAIKGAIATEDFARLTMTYNYNRNFAGYPFKYSIDIQYELREAHQLYIHTLIKNEDDVVIPIADGWHPYFTLGDRIDDYLLEFQTGTEVLFGDDMIPTGQELAYEKYTGLRKIADEKFDNCFRLNRDTCQPLVVLRNPTNGLELQIRPGVGYPFLQIYTPPHRQSIALENLSAAPDCFNNGIGLKVLQPQETVTLSTCFMLKENPIN